MSNDKVINTRVSKDLYDKISTKARKHRVTISNLIRTLVEDTLEVHAEIHDAIDKKIKTYLADGEKEDLLGFQEVALAKEAPCDDCGKILRTTDTAFVAVFARGDVKMILCSSCKTKQSHAST